LEKSRVLQLRFEVFKKNGWWVGGLGVDPGFNSKTNNKKNEKNLQEIFSSCYSHAK
jgi:hypothetical protein